MISQFKVFNSPLCMFPSSKQHCNILPSNRVGNMTPTQHDIRALLSLSLNFTLSTEVNCCSLYPVCGEFRPGPAAAANGAVLGDYEIAGVLSDAWSSAYYIHISIYTYIQTDARYMYTYRNHMLFESVVDHKLALNVNWKPCQETQPQTPFGIVSI